MDDVFSLFDISGSALSAERRRMGLIANNIANANTTKGIDGKPYRRKYAVFSTILNNEVNSIGSDDYLREKGVKIEKIVTDQSPFISIYDPNHPDADEKGYVQYPNVNILEEMVDLLASSRAYEANITVIKVTKSIIMKSIELLKI